MYDGSNLPLEENLRNTVEVVRFAHSRGVTVEAELGHVGNASVGNMADDRRNENPEDTLTDPAEVARFAGETDVDALAVAIGTAHGVYQKTPVLRIDRLDEIRAICGCPLVLHAEAVRRMSKSSERFGTELPKSIFIPMWFRR